MLFLVFFFMQKTAYDMRISDWSSDVCSSDLSADGRARSFGRVLGDAPAAVGQVLVAFLPFAGAVRRRDLHGGDLVFRAIGRPVGIKIGRASCREGVWQYV